MNLRCASDSSTSVERLVWSYSGQVPIYGPDDLLDFRKLRNSIFVAAKQKSCTTARAEFHLKHGVVDHGWRVSIERGDVNVGCNSDNRKQGAIAPIKTLPEGALASEILGDERLTHDGHRHRVRAILVVEIAPLQEWDSHGLKIRGTDHRIRGPMKIIGSRVLKANPDLAFIA